MPGLLEHRGHIYLCVALFKKRLELSLVQSTLLTYRRLLDLFSIVCLRRLQNCLEIGATIGKRNAFSPKSISKPSQGCPFEFSDTLFANFHRDAYGRPVIGSCVDRVYQ